MKTTTIVSIDTGDPESKSSTTAFVKIVFSGDGTKVRSAFAYTGSFASQYAAIRDFVGDADFVVIERIDATNKFLSRSVVAEQLAVANLISKDLGKEVSELVRSGRKHIVTDDLLKLTELFSEGKHAGSVHHHDVREATRNLLYFMAKSKDLNPILSNYVRRFLS